MSKNAPAGNEPGDEREEPLPGGPEGYRDADVLRELYVERELSGVEIANIYDVSPATVYRWMPRAGIDTRTTKETVDNSHRGRPHRDADVLRELYVEQKLSVGEVADRLDAHRDTIEAHLRKNGIEVRSAAEQSTIANHRKYEGEPYADADVLRELYVEQEMSAYEIGDRFGVSNHCIQTHMERHGIERDPYRHHRKYGDFVLGRPHDPYPGVRGGDGDFIPTHVLVAIADGADPHRVFSPETEVHHINGAKVDNRPSNLSVVDTAEHARIHRRGRFTYADLESFVRYVVDPAYRERVEKEAGE